MDGTEKTPKSEGTSFFSLPSSWYVWSRLGTKFWAGVLVGVGLGLLLGAVLVEQELMTLHRKAWVSVTGVILAALGQAIAWRAASCSHRPEQTISARNAL